MEDKFLLIYNPHAGKKKSFFGVKKVITPEELTTLFAKYKLSVDIHETKYAGHATKLAAQALKKKYAGVLVAGGDGTVGEAANALAKTQMPLGIIPLGSFMNIANMVAIPTDIEQAIAVIKKGKILAIDLGCIEKLNGKKLSKPYYFIEVAGIGIEAHVHKNILRLEKGNYRALLILLKKMIDFYPRKIKITLDKEVVETNATLVTIANGPLSGASLKLAPAAKLNDHKLTICVYRMSKGELIKHMIQLLLKSEIHSKRITTYHSEKVVLESSAPRLLHADGRIFGATPAEFNVIPNALRVFTGISNAHKPSALITKDH